jgi:hypothetical protein
MFKDDKRRSSGGKSEKPIIQKIGDLISPLITEYYVVPKENQDRLAILEEELASVNAHLKHFTKQRERYKKEATDYKAKMKTSPSIADEGHAKMLDSRAKINQSQVVHYESQKHKLEQQKKALLETMSRESQSLKPPSAGERPGAPRPAKGLKEKKKVDAAEVELEKTVLQILEAHFSPLFPKEKRADLKVLDEMLTSVDVKLKLFAKLLNTSKDDRTQHAEKRSSRSTPGGDIRMQSLNRSVKHAEEMLTFWQGEKERLTQRRKALTQEALPADKSLKPPSPPPKKA